MYSKNNEIPWIKNKYVKEHPSVIQPEYVQSGTGNDVVNSLLFAKNVLETVPKIAGAANELAFGSIGTAVSNTLGEYYNKNPEWKAGYAGEKHMILPTSYGLTRANYAGPGTHLEKRLARGDKGVDGPFGIDSAAKLHDIRYAVATTPEDIRMADNELIRNVERSTQGPKTKKFVINAMKAKKFAEDKGILAKDYYLENKQKGFGSDNKQYPAQLLKKRLKKHKKEY